ncbi:hypothetical protein Nepgr_018199 [Nepenthes gracilis]|uniref:Uncharacterized protein n=1 Tax=Nepenthes gracilis TaxID=150966 RepID=A0AAD3SRU8_NEPGR|nr:hypothetical protein Nepgr_018199 [Nepenthes gracilis]
MGRLKPSNVMRKCAKFARWIDDFGLIDLGFTGPKFTWWKEVGGKPYMKVRLDRAFPGTSKVDRVGAADPIETKTKPEADPDAYSLPRR